MHRSNIVVGISALAAIVLFLFCSEKIIFANNSFSLEDASIQEEVSSIACALSEGQICFDFDNLSDIPPTCLSDYLASRRTDFFTAEECREDPQNLVAYLDYGQIVQILKHDFNVDELPFEVENKENFVLRIQLGTLMRGYHNIEMQKKGNVVIATVYYSHFEYAGPLDGGDWAPVSEQGRILYRMVYELKYIDNHFVVNSGRLLYGWGDYDGYSWD